MNFWRWFTSPRDSAARERYAAAAELSAEISAQRLELERARLDDDRKRHLLEVSERLAEQVAEQERIAAPKPEAQHQPCACGSVRFTAGGPVITPVVTLGIPSTEVSGAILCCLECGARRYQTSEGLREPHPDALPPAWAAMELQQRAARARTEAHERAEMEKPKQTAPRRNIEREYRRPPRAV